MQIAVIGTRGFPGVQGGVEKHCESLYSVIGGIHPCSQIVVYRRRPYVQEISAENKYSNIKFVDLWAKKNKYCETILHSLIATFCCAVHRPDIVHVHNIGPALVLPFLKLLNIRTVVTYHSDNYNHDKWGMVAKKTLRVGEFFVRKLSDEVITVSQNQLKKVNSDNATFIPNGVELPNVSKADDYIRKMGLESVGYILAVARFAPEKGLALLVDAFQRLDTNLKLVIAGDSDHESTYSLKLRRMIEADDRIIHTGYITGNELNQVFSHARLFVLPSFHEGLPIALLEAMSYGLPVLVSDIPANIEVDLPAERYFKCGDVNDLVKKLDLLIDIPLTTSQSRDLKIQVAQKYNWLRIAEKTMAVYEKALAS
ncbi:glycosyltransferase family 4 protein [Desulfoluna butyratoxydans]|uniref:Glycosyl transferase family 1 n=1 Tax=Desulfoluna butyratoxydans TaxID=231438 RepID=A0A4U8YRP9_9BACT|nr:glycosyltransferase family 4 protein [Desulfoluna butyratoxydans]VFQ46561.1 glycosyl transferase family 1 [Desulfoluna butyratoxydans]